MADDTGRRLIRQAQREGRLGTLSPGARSILTRLTKCCEAAKSHQAGAPEEWWSGRVRSDSHGWDWADSDDMATEGKAEHARELGAFLAQLAEWMS